MTDKEEGLLTVNALKTLLNSRFCQTIAIGLTITAFLKPQLDHLVKNSDIQTASIQSTLEISYETHNTVMLLAERCKIRSIPNGR